MNIKRNWIHIGIVFTTLFLSTCNTTPTPTTVSTAIVTLPPTKVSVPISPPPSLIFEALAPAATGDGIPEATLYDPSTNKPHLIVLLDSTGKPHTWNGNMPPDWLPGSVNETELVALIGPEEEVALDTKRYIISGSEALPITRYRFEIRVKVREARTGHVLWQDTLRGSEPGPFPETAPAGQTRIDGDHVLFETLQEWLSCKVSTQTCEMLTLEEAFFTPVRFAFPPDNQTLFVFSDYKPVSSWRISDGTPLQTLGPEGTYREATFSPDGQILATWDEDYVELWNVSNGDRIDMLGHWPNLTSLEFSPDGRWLALGLSGGAVVEVWDMTGGEMAHTLQSQTIRYTEWAWNIAFSSDGTMLATGLGSGAVILWDIANEREIGTLQGHNSGVVNVAFSPEGTYLATGTNDENAIILWRVSDGKQVRTFQGHTGWINSLSFSPDGQWLASGSSDGTVKIWEVASGRELLTLNHPDIVLRVAFSPDGQILVSAANDHKVRIWRTCQILPCP